jgi:hypothetical protein
MSILKRTLLLGAMLVAGGAQAATIDFTTSFGPSLTDIDTGPLTVAGFSSSLGTLTGVHIEYGFSTNFNGTVKNTSGHAVSNFRITASVIPTLTFFGPASIAGDIDLFTTSGQQSFGSVADGATVAFGPVYSNDGGALDPVTLSQFINSNFTYGVSTESSFTVTGSGNNAENHLTTLGSGFVTVTYTYDAAPPPVPTVPEPASWAMMLVGFGAMGSVLRRGRRVAVSFG